MKKLWIYRLDVSYGGGAVGIIAPDQEAADSIVQGEYTYGRDGKWELIESLEVATDLKDGLLFNETTAE